jgi:hypothetical protein
VRPYDQKGALGRKASVYMGLMVVFMVLISSVARNIMVLMMMLMVLIMMLRAA